MAPAARRAAAAVPPPRRGGPLDRFEKVRELGRGSYGAVWLVRRKADRKLLAMKTIPLPPLASRDERAVAERRQAMREVEILKGLESPHLVHYVDAILAPASAEQSQSELHILMEHCNAGDLATHIRSARPKHGFPEEDVWFYTVAILEGLNTLHGQRILHRDLKPANIFLKRGKQSRPSASRRVSSLLRRGSSIGRSQSRGAARGAGGGMQVLVGDLGVARAMTESQPLASTMIGTPHYCAPEIFEGQPYDEKADIYSCGVCVYELMHGCTPHAEAKNLAALVMRVVRLDSDAAPRELQMDGRYSEDLRGLVAACLAPAPEARPTAAELLARVPAAQRAAVAGGGEAAAAPPPAPTAAPAAPAPLAALEAAGAGEARAGAEEAEATLRSPRLQIEELQVELTQMEEPQTEEATLRLPAPEAEQTVEALLLPPPPPPPAPPAGAFAFRPPGRSPGRVGGAPAPAPAEQPGVLLTAAAVAASAAPGEVAAPAAAAAVSPPASPRSQCAVTIEDELSGASESTAASSADAAAGPAAAAAPAAGGRQEAVCIAQPVAPPAALHEAATEPLLAPLEAHGQPAGEPSPRPPSARPRSAAAELRPSSASGKRSVMSYVGRARECMSRWNRERQEAKGKRLSCGAKGHLAANKQNGGVAARGEALEIRGIAVSIPPKVVREGGRL